MGLRAKRAAGQAWHPGVPATRNTLEPVPAHTALPHPILPEVPSHHCSGGSNVTRWGQPCLRCQTGLSLPLGPGPGSRPVASPVIRGLTHRLCQLCQTGIRNYVRLSLSPSNIEQGRAPGEPAGPASPPDASAVCQSLLDPWLHSHRYLVSLKLPKMDGERVPSKHSTFYFFGEA